MTLTFQQNCQIIEWLTEKTWGWGWVVLFLFRKLTNGSTFHSFHKEELGELLAKNIARTAKRQLTDNICELENIFAKLQKPLIC